MFGTVLGRGTGAGRPFRALTATVVAGVITAAGAGASAYAGAPAYAANGQTMRAVVAPGPPRMVRVLPGVGQLIVSWQAPATSGDGITSYVVHANATDLGSGCTVPARVRSCTIELGPEWTYRVSVEANGRNHTASAEAVADHPYRPLRTTALPVLATVPAAAGSLASSAGRKLSAPGATTTITGSGYAAHTTIKVTIFSAPRQLATTTTTSTGAFQVRVTLPVGYGGSHTLVAAGLGPTGTVRYLNLPVTLPSTGTGAGLPVTGAPARPLIRVGLLLLACGVLLRLLGRRPVRVMRAPR